MFRPKQSPAKAKSPTLYGEIASPLLLLAMTFDSWCIIPSSNYHYQQSTAVFD